jgi:hypothetical protein
MESPDQQIPAYKPSSQRGDIMAQVQTTQQTKGKTKGKGKGTQAQAASVPYFAALLSAINADPKATIVRAFLARAKKHHDAKGTTFPRPTTAAARAAMTASKARAVIERIAKGEGKAVAGSHDGQAVYDLLMIGADLTPEQRAK